MTGHATRRRRCPPTCGRSCPRRPGSRRGATSRPRAFPRRGARRGVRPLPGRHETAGGGGQARLRALPVRPWVPVQPAPAWTSSPRFRPGFPAAPWPWSSATARGFPSTRARRWRPCAPVGLAHVVVDAPATANAVPRVAAGHGAHLGLPAPRPERGGLAAPAPRGASRPCGRSTTTSTRKGELRALLPEVDAAAGEAERVFISFNNNNRAYPVQNALMMRRLLRTAHPGRRARSGRALRASRNARLKTAPAGSPGLW